MACHRYVEQVIQVMRNKFQPQLDDIINGRLRLHLDIQADDGSLIGELRPLTTAQLSDDHVIGKITRWRNENMENFLTQFEATPKRTMDWLRNVVFKAQGQLLFMVCVDGQAIGHLGFKNLTQDDVLLDNVMRGERVGHPKLFVHASKVLNEWLFKEAGVQTIYGYVMTNNATALMMNKQVGFGGWTRYPLLRKTDGADVRLDLGSQGESSPDNLYCFKIVLTKLKLAPSASINLNG